MDPGDTAKPVLATEFETAHNRLPLGNDSPASATFLGRAASHNGEAVLRLLLADPARQWSACVVQF